MKAMILAAGLGQRMRPLTLTVPKPLVAIQGQALIDYHFLAFKKAHITEVVINVYHLGQQIIDHVTAHWDREFKLHFFHEKELLGTGGGVYQALSLFDDEPFIVVSADVFTDYPYAQLPQQLTGLAHLVMVTNPSFYPQGDFYLNPHGRLSLHDGLSLTYGNIGVFHPTLFAHAQKTKFEMREVLLPAISAAAISAEHYTGRWENIGTLAQLESLNSSCN